MYHAGAVFLYFLVLRITGHLVMTDLANVSALTRTPGQLPIDWYFDPRVAEIEQRVLFESGPGYVGHELMVPEVGDYRSLDWMNHAKVLVHNQSFGGSVSWRIFSSLRR